MSLPKHVNPVNYVDVIAVVQFIDRGLLVNKQGEEYLIHEVKITYRWFTRPERWEVQSTVGGGYRVMPGTRDTGATWKTIDAMHPDYRELAQIYAPRWKPVPAVSATPAR